MERGLDNWKKKMVHMETDGASVYTGCNNVVIVKLQKEIPWLTGMLVYT